MPSSVFSVTSVANAVGSLRIAAVSAGPDSTIIHPHPGLGRGAAARLRAGSHPLPPSPRYRPGSRRPASCRVPPTSTLTRVSAGEPPPGCVPGSRRAPLMRRGPPLRPGAHHGAETTTQLLHHGDTETRRTAECLDLAVYVAITIRQSDCRMRFLKRDQTRSRPPCLRVSVVNPITVSPQ